MSPVIMRRLIYAGIRRAFYARSFGNIYLDHLLLRRPSRAVPLRTASVCDRVSISEASQGRAPTPGEVYRSPDDYGAAADLQRDVRRGAPVAFRGRARLPAGEAACAGPRRLH